MTDPAPDATALANRRTGVNTLLLALPAYLLIAAAWPLVSPRLVTAGFANAQGAFSNTMLLFGCTVLAVIAAGTVQPNNSMVLEKAPWALAKPAVTSRGETSGHAAAISR